MPNTSRAVRKSRKANAIKAQVLSKVRTLPQHIRVDYSYYLGLNKYFTSNSKDTSDLEQSKRRAQALRVLRELVFDSRQHCCCLRKHPSSAVFDRLFVHSSGNVLYQRSGTVSGGSTLAGLAYRKSSGRFVYARRDIEQGTHILPFCGSLFPAAALTFLDFAHPYSLAVKGEQAVVLPHPCALAAYSEYLASLHDSCMADIKALTPQPAHQNQHAVNCSQTKEDATCFMDMPRFHGFPVLIARTYITAGSELTFWYGGTVNKIKDHIDFKNPDDSIVATVVKKAANSGISLSKFICM
jgi:hypothetical protein